MSQVGTISLQHDIYNITVAEVPFTLDILKNSSYSVELISKCRNIYPVYDNHILEKTSFTPEYSTATQRNPNNISGINYIDRNRSAMSNGHKYRNISFLILSIYLFL